MKNPFYYIFFLLLTEKNAVLKNSEIWKQ